MDNTQKTIINYSVKVETKAWIEEFAQSTERSQGNVIDLLVSEARERVNKAARDTMTVEEALAQEAG